MARTEVYEVTCGACGAETTVAEVYYPATRYEPPDGETHPEECPGCGKPWDATDTREVAEPPEPDLDDHFDARYDARLDYPERHSGHMKGDVNLV